MKFSAVTLTTVLAGISLAAFGVQGFSPSIGDVIRSHKSAAVGTRQSCNGVRPVSARSWHAPACNCGLCREEGFGGMTKLLGLRNDDAEFLLSRKKRCAMTRLYADATDEAEAPAIEDEDNDEIEKLGMTPEERHSMERPQRQSLSKKRKANKKTGKPLSEFSAGQTLKATVKSVTTYGAFCDFGGNTDGLLHISRMSKGFVSDASDIVSVGDEVEVRLLEVNTERNQVALTLLTVEEENEVKQDQEGRQASNRKRGGDNRGDKEAVKELLAEVREKGYDSNQWIDGVVVSTPSFGAFVRIDASKINEELEGSFDGLVHISALTEGRADSVDQYASIDKEVKVRIRSIGADGKVALTMTSVEYDEEQKNRPRNDEIGGDNYGYKDWKNALGEIEQPEFTNPIFFNRKKFEKNIRGAENFY